MLCCWNNHIVRGGEKGCLNSCELAHLLLPMHVLESLATFLPSGQTQTPPSSEDRQSYSHPNEEHNVVAESKQKIHRVNMYPKHILITFCYSIYNTFSSKQTDRPHCLKNYKIPPEKNGATADKIDS